MIHSDYTAYNEYAVELAFVVEFDKQLVVAAHEDVGGNDPYKLNKEKFY